MSIPRWIGRAADVTLSTTVGSLPPCRLERGAGPFMVTKRSSWMSARRVPAAWHGRGPYWWRRRRGDVLWPLAIGLELCALGLWSGLKYEHDLAVFHAHAVRAEATIDEIYTSAPSQDYNAPTFDEYGLVHFDAQGKRAHARVLLAT